MLDPACELVLPGFSEVSQLCLGLFAMSRNGFYITGSLAIIAQGRGMVRYQPESLLPPGHLPNITGLAGTGLAVWPEQSMAEVNGWKESGFSANGRY